MAVGVSGVSGIIVLRRVELEMSHDIGRAPTLGHSMEGHRVMAPARSRLLAIPTSRAQASHVIRRKANNSRPLNVSYSLRSCFDLRRPVNVNSALKIIKLKALTLAITLYELFFRVHPTKWLKNPCAELMNILHTLKFFNNKEFRGPWSQRTRELKCHAKSLDCWLSAVRISG